METITPQFSTVYTVHSFLFETPLVKEILRLLFIEYPKCATCQKVRRWLVANEISFQSRHIKGESPGADELKSWHSLSGLPLKKFFNTSGLKYKELRLKDKLPNMIEEEQITLLASDGMLVKRPILVGVVLYWWGSEKRSGLPRCVKSEDDWNLPTVEVRREFFMS